MAENLETFFSNLGTSQHLGSDTLVQQTYHVGQRIEDFQKKGDLVSARNVFIEMAKAWMSAENNENVSVDLAKYLDFVCWRIDISRDSKKTEGWDEVAFSVGYLMDKTVGPVRSFYRKAINWNLLNPRTI